MDTQLSWGQVEKVSSRSSGTSPSKEPICLQDIKTDAALAVAIQCNRIVVAAYLKAEGNWQRRRSYAFVLRSIKDDESSGSALLKVLKLEDMKREIGSFL